MRYALFVLVFVFAACAQPEAPVEADPDPAEVAPLTVENAWARPAAAGGNSALYITLVGGSAADTLLSAESAAVNTVEVHESFETETGTMGMRPVGMLPVPAGETVALQPGSFHVMLIGAEADLVVGERVAAVLTFSQTGPISVMAQISETAPDGMVAGDAEHEDASMDHSDLGDADASE
ncbi:MAG: copper chaperone PCu(A)C [Bacteroidota bacterium]